MAQITGDGTVTPERIARLQQGLQDDGALFEQPDGAFVTRDEYLSGDVVSKLADATAAAEAEPPAPVSVSPAARRGRFQANVEVLTAVQPRPKTVDDIDSGEIKVALGAHWIDPEDIAAFVASAVGVEERKCGSTGRSSTCAGRWISRTASSWPATATSSR